MKIKIDTDEYRNVHFISKSYGIPVDVDIETFNRWKAAMVAYCNAQSEMRNCIDGVESKPNKP